MTFKILDFQCALVTGGSSGLGKAMSEYFLSLGKKVIILGRTESHLEKAAREMGNIPYYVLDTGNISAIPGFVERVTKEHRELDCLVNNAGVQMHLDVFQNSPEEFFSKADQEININVRGPMHLIIHLPHFKIKPGATIINVSSLLGFIPYQIITPVYNATKAWQHPWSLTLRTQLQGAGHGYIRVVEVAPALVTTNLHRDHEDPRYNTKDKAAMAMSVEEFLRDVTRQLEKERETMSAGLGMAVVERWEKEVGEGYGKAAGEYVRGEK
jgi:short-subunit dehydrogenase involved in D-alanine esterification of teichoic acids